LFRLLLDSTLGPDRDRMLELAARALPGRASAFWREVYELRRDAQRYAQAADALDHLIELERDAHARSALNVELGELFHNDLGDDEQALRAFEVALAEDAASTIAVQQLMRLYRKFDRLDRFVVMAERLAQLTGSAGNEALQDDLAQAYESLGRKEDALKALAALSETPERLTRRAALAFELGLTGEALALRERLTDSPEELEKILAGYLERDLTSFAVKLGTRLIQAGQLSAAGRRRLAERVSGTTEGASVAAALWPEMLKANPADAEAWTYFAEALRQLGKTEEAQVVDGFGAALTGSALAATSAPLHPLPELVSVESRWPDRPLLALTAENMPRLHHAVKVALDGLGAAAVQPYLDPQGGPWAFQAGPDGLVIGAGALSCFGASELTYLTALALSLGRRGAELPALGPVEGFTEAALAAFEAYPSSLSAARVIAHLDERVRGKDPTAFSPAELLHDSPAFRALALAVLGKMRQ
jgi:tetratricopeptide (TPR) repeat protein